MMPRRLLGPALSSAVLVSALGCEPPVMRARIEVPRRTTEQVTHDLRTTPEVRRLVEELSREATQGAVDGLVDAETAERVHTIVAQLSRAMLDEVASGMRGPAGRELTSGVTRSVMRSLEDELSRSVGPAMRRMVVEDLLRQPEFRQALNETSREVGREAALGTAEVLAQAAERKRERGLLPIAASLLPATGWLVVATLLVVLGVPLVLLLRERRDARRFREEMERKTAVAAALIHAAEAERDEPALRSALARAAASLTSEDASVAPGETPREAPPGGTLRPA